MKILFVLHASFENPGSIEDWAKKRNHFIQKVSPYRGEALPNVDAFDFLVVMGGPQSPLELDKAPYLKDEIELIKQAIEKNKPIVGICLGAQLIGEALGAKTEHSPHREIGMHAVELLQDAKSDPVFSKFPDKFEVMHWHNDMPGIAEGAVLLAKSAGCPRQVFRYGDRVYGFQCHLEFTKEIAQGMILNCLDDLSNHGTYVSTVKEILEADFTEINSKLESVLEYLAKLSETSRLEKSWITLTF